MVWGTGDGSTLTVLDTPFGRLGGLLCWENYMPLARAAMYAQGVDIYVAPTWDPLDSWVATLRHIAKEGRVFVVATNTCLRASDIPADLPGRDALYAADDDWIAPGNTTIVGPDGEIIAGPLIGDDGILYAEVDAAVAHRSRREFDPVGHYARPDVFHLTVDTAPKRPVEFTRPPAST
jgi:nitrilase